jgi:hypothetical protein
MAISRVMMKPMHPKSAVQPKLIPTAGYEQRMAREYGHVLKHRQKLLMAHFGQVVDIPDSAGAGPTPVIGFHGQVDAWCDRLIIRLGVARANYDPPEDPTGEPADCRIEIVVVGTGSGTVTHVHHVGLSGGASLDVPSEWSWPRLVIPCFPEEDLSVLIKVADEARLITAGCWGRGGAEDQSYEVEELAAAVGAPIIRTARQTLAENLTTKWRQGAAALMNLHAPTTPFSRSSATYANPYDNTTSVTSATAGANLETTRHNTVAQATVPVRLAVYARTTSGSSGKVRVRHASGDVAEVTGIGTTLQWYTDDGSIPAGTTKCDFQIAGDGTNSVELYFATLYERQ